VVLGTLAFFGGSAAAQDDDENMTEVDTAGALVAYRDTASGDVVVVYPPATNIAEVSKGLPDGYRAVRSGMTKDEIKQLKSELVAIGETLGEGGVAGIYFAGQTDKVTVDTNRPNLFKRFRDDPNVDIREVAGGSRLGRTNDPSPHKGGAVVIGDSPSGPGDGACTSGFTVKKSSGTKYMVTAGHCFSLSASVEGGTGLSWGMVTQRAPFPAKDAELIGAGTYTHEFYRGALVGTLEDVSGAGNPAVGNTYCASGMWTGTDCNWFMTDLDAEGCWDDGCTDNLAKAEGTAADHGDSGGPLYIKIDGTYRVRGILVGELGAFGYFTKWSTIRDTFDVTIVTP
jgi:hypothetical protein